MTDIFISYSRHDRPRAEMYARAFESQGWSVWWDRTIPAGKTFDEVIEENLDAAGCLVVLWSKRSANSRWVRTEAGEGAKREILVPVLIEECKIPLAFRRIQTPDLSAWEGDVRLHRGHARQRHRLSGSQGPPLKTWPSVVLRAGGRHRLPDAVRQQPRAR